MSVIVPTQSLDAALSFEWLGPRLMPEIFSICFASNAVLDVIFPF